MDRMDLMMNAIKGRKATHDGLVHFIDSPFIARVTSCPLPPKFRMPSLETYDGTKDPLDHLKSFKTLMHLQGIPDEIMCWAFHTTLKGPTWVWFNKITPNSISTFKELSWHIGHQHKPLQVKLHSNKWTSKCLMGISDDNTNPYRWNSIQTCVQNRSGDTSRGRTYKLQSGSLKWKEEWQRAASQP